MSPSSLTTKGTKSLQKCSRSIKTKLTIYFSFLFIAIITGIVYVDMMGIPFTSYIGDITELKKETARSLNLIADLKKDRLMRWMKERHDDTHVTSENNFAISSVIDILEVFRRHMAAGREGSKLWAMIRQEKSYIDLVWYLDSIRTAYGVYDRIRVADAISGIIVISTDDTDLGTDVSKRTYFKGALQINDVYASGIDLFHRTHSHGLHFSRAVKDKEGKAVAILIMEINTDDIFKPMLHTGDGLGKRGEALLVNKEMRILTSLKHPLADGTIAKPIQYRIKAQPAILAAGGKEGIIEANDYRGEPVLAAYRYIPVSGEWGWGMVVKRDREELFEYMQQHFNIMVFISLAGVCCFVGFAIVIAGNLTRPIESLGQTAQELTQGDLSARAAVNTQDEVGALAKTFNFMAGRVQNWHEELECQVDVQTKELKKEITERERAEEELRRSERELKISDQISKVFLTTANEEMFEKILDIVLNALGSKYGTFGYIDPDRDGAFICPSMTRDIWGKCQVADKEIIFERGTWGGIWGRAIKEKKSLYSNSGPFKTPEGHIPIKNTMVVPVIFNDEVVSAVHIANKMTDYDEKDQELLESIANHIAPVLSARLQKAKEERERKRAEEEKRKALENFDVLYNSSKDAIIYTNLEGVFLFVNDAFTELTGYSREELLNNKTFQELTPEEYHQFEAKLFEEHVRTYQPVEFEKEYIRKDGSRVPILVTGFIMKGSGDEQPRVGAIIKDITERKWAEEEIKLLAKYPEENPNPVLRIKKDGTIKFANQASGPILEAFNCKLGLCKHGECLPDDWNRQIKEIYKSQQSKEVELEHKGRVFSITITPFTDTDYLYCYGRDITEQKQAEIELHKHRRHLQDLVDERTVELTDSNVQLKQEINVRKKTERKLRQRRKELQSLASELSLAEEKERRRIAVGLHDDIGQTLYISKMKLEALLESAPSTDVDKCLIELIENIEQTIQRTRNLTFELCSPILYELGFGSALKSLTEQINQQHGIAFEFDDDGEHKLLDNEAHVLLYQSVRELLANVAKHAQANRVRVSAKREDNNIRIDVDDDGVGFDSSRLTTHISEEGGFGLFSIHERLAYLGGCLELESEPGRGTRVSLVTPLRNNKKKTEGNA